MIDVGLDRHIEISPARRTGRPVISGTRLAVADIVIMHLRLAYALEEIAAKFDVPLSAVHAAMAYYYDHKSEIDERIDEDQTYVAAFKQNNPSPLQEKLRALGRD